MTNSYSAVGPCPVGWSIARLGDIATHVGSGATPSGGSKAYLDRRVRDALVRSQNVFDRHFSDTGLAFISPDDAEKLKGVSLEADDVLLNITGDGITFARSCLVPNRILPAVVNQHVVRIRCDANKCIPGFLLSFLTHDRTKAYIESFNAGGSRRAITKAQILSFDIPLPPLDEQRAIASILGSLDDKIELNRRMNRTLEQMAAAIFREQWGHASTAEVAVPIAELERRAILLIGDGYRAKRSELADSGPAFIRAGDVKGRVDPSNAERLSPESAERAGVKNSQLWDSVFTTKGTVGRLGLVTQSTGDVVYAPQVCFWRSKSSETLHPLVLHEWMKSMLFTRQWQAVKGQTDMADFVSLTDQRLMTMDLLEPNDQNELGQRLQPLYDLIDSNAAENQTLTETRDALLPKLLSGEMRVGQHGSELARAR